MQRACVGGGRARQCVAVVKDAGSQQLEDPEKKFRQYGPSYGGRYSLDSAAQWLSEAPRVRIRSMQDRKLDELLELAVLNERLAGMPSHEVRRRLEYIKLRRRNWEAIYHYITETEAVATLALIEEANRKVEAALSEEAQQTMGVGALQGKLLGLRQEVDIAAEKLKTTQARVDQNLKRVSELKAEAAALERMRLASPSLPAPAASMAVASTSRASATATAVAEPPAVALSSRPPARALSPQPMAPLPEERSSKRKNRGLHSSLEIEEGLRNFWFPAEFSKVLVKDTLVPFELFGESWVLFRDEHGKPACIKDTCAHRACPLSLGKIEGGQVTCAYHGWRFDGSGQCTAMPSTAFCRNVAVAALPCAEKDGFVWVWPGFATPDDELPGFTAPPAGFDVHAEIMVDVPVEHGLLVENLLDLAHAPFTHTTTFARGWPVPDLVRFHANKMLAGNWDPYPINMSFQPPCATLSMIGLAQPGKIMRGVQAEQCSNHLHQLHVCMPSKKGHTRLLYRMSMDFMGWVRHVPGIQMLWKKVAAQVLGEDLVLVLGQQDRMQRGEDTWANPMAYDKLAVRYRRWRNSVAEGNRARAAKHLAGADKMSAGELFSDQETDDEGDLMDEDRLLNVAAPVKPPPAGAAQRAQQQ